jgi:hypothetical protein
MHHLLQTASPAVFDRTLRFLKEGRFLAEGEARPIPEDEPTPESAPLTADASREPRRK